MIAPMLSKTFDGQDVTGWLMSEKLDGVRAIWNGQTLVSRNGNAFNAPERFLQALPKDTALDGELYAGKINRQLVVSILRHKTPAYEDWRMICFRVFDAPEIDGGFADRLAAATDAVEDSTVATAIPHRVCAGNADMLAFFHTLIDNRAEGIVLRDPSASYVAGRSGGYLKLKPF